MDLGPSDQYQQEIMPRHKTATLNMETDDDRRKKSINLSVQTIHSWVALQKQGHNP